MLVMSTPFSSLLQGHSSHVFILWNVFPNDLPTGNPLQAILGSVHRTGLCILPSNMSILVAYLALCNSTALLPVCPPPVTTWRYLVGMLHRTYPMFTHPDTTTKQGFCVLVQISQSSLLFGWDNDNPPSHLSLLNSGAPQHPWLPLWWLQRQLGRPEESLLSLCYSMKNHRTLGTLTDQELAELEKSISHLDHPLVL